MLCTYGRQQTAAQAALYTAANLEGASVCKDMRSTKGFQSVCTLCEAACSLLTLPHNGHTPKLQQMAQLDDQLAHRAVGCIQNDTVPGLQSQTKLSKEDWATVQSSLWMT